MPSSLLAEREPDCRQLAGRGDLMPNSIVTADQDALVTEIEVAAPPSRVFEALTDAKQISRWWGSEGPCKSKVWEFDARVGGT